VLNISGMECYFATSVWRRPDEMRFLMGIIVCFQYEKVIGSLKIFGRGLM
jgi:hypothetical protein